MRSYQSLPGLNLAAEASCCRPRAWPPATLVTGSISHHGSTCRTATPRPPPTRDRLPFRQV